MAIRRQLLEQLNANLATRDTPRGLIVTVHDVDFNGQYLRGNAGSKLAGLAQILVANPSLRIEIEGNADSEGAQVFSQRRADAVRDVLVGSGVPVDRVSTRGLGNSRPLVSNSSPNGREENRRVEIVISGDTIGNVPFRDRTYRLQTGG
jgi:outer membrane protein OmpA-like peptidoglycan-associated protein